jgi:hypothetical protein
MEPLFVAHVDSPQGITVVTLLFPVEYRGFVLVEMFESGMAERSLRPVNLNNYMGQLISFTFESGEQGLSNGETIYGVNITSRMETSN